MAEVPAAGRAGEEGRCAAYFFRPEPGYLRTLDLPEGFRARVAGIRGVSFAAIALGGAGHLLLGRATRVGRAAPLALLTLVVGELEVVSSHGDP